MRPRLLMLLMAAITCGNAVVAGEYTKDEILDALKSVDPLYTPVEEIEGYENHGAEIEKVLRSLRKDCPLELLPTLRRIARAARRRYRDLGFRHSEQKLLRFREEELVRGMIFVAIRQAYPEPEDRLRFVCARWATIDSVDIRKQLDFHEHQMLYSMLFDVVKELGAGDALGRMSRLVLLREWPLYLRIADPSIEDRRRNFWRSSGLTGEFSSLPQIASRYAAIQDPVLSRMWQDCFYYQLTECAVPIDKLDEVTGQKGLEDFGERLVERLHKSLPALLEEKKRKLEECSIGVDDENSLARMYRRLVDLKQRVDALAE